MAGSGINRLELLLRDYEAALEDKRSFDALTSSVFAVGITLSAAIGALLTRACRPTDAAFPWLEIGSTNDDCTAVSPYAMSVVPLIPVMVLAILLVQGMSASMRSRYLRLLELAIRREASLPDTDPVPYGSTHLMHRMAAGDGAFSRRQAMLFHLQWIPASIIAVGVSAGAVSLIDDGRIQTVSIVIYASAGIVLISGLFAANFRSGRLWQRLNGLFAEDLERTRARFPKRRQYSLRYVLIPRPIDLLSKAPLHALAFYVGSQVSSGGIGVARIILFTAALEVVLYQTRYAVNDLRDMGRDGLHREARKRMRLPNSVAGLRSGAYAIAWRAVAMVALLVLLPNLLRSTFAVAVGTLVVSTMAYESVKSRLKRPGANVARWARLLFVTVGIGYGVRVGAGLHLGGLGPGAVALGTFFGYSLGVMFVTMTWTLEGYAYGPRHETAQAKPHCAFLLDELVGDSWPMPGDFTNSKGTPITDTRDVPILDRRVRPGSTVYVVMLATLAGAVALGTAIVGTGATTLLVSAAALACVAAVVLVAVPRMSLARSLLVWILMAAVNLVGLSLDVEACRAALPMTLALSVFTFFQNQRYRAVNPDLHLLVLQVRHAAVSAYRTGFWIVLSDAAYQLRFGAARHDDVDMRRRAHEEQLATLRIADGEPNQPPQRSVEVTPNAERAALEELGEAPPDLRCR